MKKGMADDSTGWLNLVTAPIVLLSSQGKIELVNRGLCQLLQYGEDEMIGKEWVEFCHPEHRGEERAMLEALTSPGNRDLKKWQGYLMGKEEDIRMVEWQGRIIKGANGKGHCIFLCGENSTEKWILKQRLAQQQAISRRELAQAVLETAERQRREIAYELHDGVNQVLTVCKLLVEGEMVYHCTPAMKRVVEQLQKSIDQIRGLSHQLDPYDLGNEGLYFAVKRLIRQTNAAGQLKIRLKLGGVHFLKSLPSSVSLNLFRIVQEAIQNILKHAGAKKVALNVYGTAAAVDIEIADDGGGFQKKPNTTALGLKSIYTRAEAMAGLAIIRSVPGEGTLVSVHVPLEQGTVIGRSSGAGNGNRYAKQ